MENRKTYAVNANSLKQKMKRRESKIQELKREKRELEKELETNEELRDGIAKELCDFKRFKFKRAKTNVVKKLSKK
jgi:hypothetical protein